MDAFDSSLNSCRHCGVWLEGEVPNKLDFDRNKFSIFTNRVIEIANSEWFRIVNEYVTEK